MTTPATAPSPESPEPPALQVLLNGEPLSIAAGISLADLLEQLGHAPRSVATVVNGDFVARDARAARRLSAGDQVMTFQPIVGG